jgi:hypothetical protein
MTVLASDNFNRADSADLGPLWDPMAPVGGFKLVGNQVVPTAPGSNAFESYNGVTWPNDHYSQARLSTASTSTSAGPGLLVRASPSALTVYQLSVSHNAASNIRLLKFVAGAPTGIMNFTQAWTDGDLFRLEVQGSLLRVFLNGLQVGTDATDSSIASGRPGLCHNQTTTSTIDDWEGGDLTTASALAATATATGTGTGALTTAIPLAGAATAAATTTAALTTGGVPGAPVGMDTFTESANTLLGAHTPDLGAGWTLEAAQFTVIAASDTLRHNRSTTDRARKGDDIGADVMDVSASVSVASSTSRLAGVCARMDTDGFANQYEAYLQFKTATTQDVFLFKNVGGTRTQLGTAVVTLNSGTAATLMLSIRAGTQEVFLNAASVIAITEPNATLSGRRYAGVILNANNTANASLDDFLSASVAVAAAALAGTASGIATGTGALSTAIPLAAAATATAITAGALTTAIPVAGAATAAGTTTAALTVPKPLAATVSAVVTGTGALSTAIPLAAAATAAATTTAALTTGGEALATDTFTRADNADLGALWDPVPPLGGFKIVGNAAVPTAVGTNAAESYNGVTWPADQYSQARLTTSGTTAQTGPGLLVRCAAAALTCYWLRASHAASNNLQLVKFVAGTPTVLGNITQAWSNGDLVRLEVQGTTLRVLVNGSQAGADITDASIATGRAGIAYIATTDGTIDDWAGGTLSTAAALAGTAPAIATGSGTLTTAIPLAAAVTAAGTTTAVLTVPKPLAAAATATGTVTGALSTAIPLAAAATGTALTAGALTSGIPLAAAATAAVTATAALTGGAAALAATATASASSVGTLTTGIPLAGGALAAATASGALTTGIPFAGAASAAVTTSAALTTALTLAGVASAVATGSGSLTTSIALVGSVTGLVTVAAVLTTTPSGLAGTAAGSASATGNLTTAIAVSGTAPVAVTVSASLTTAIPLAGSASAIVTTAAALTAGTGFSASATASVTTSGALTTALRLAATATATATSAGALTIPKPLAGTATGTATTAASLTTSAGFAASATGTAAATGGLTTQIRLTAAVLARALALGDLTTLASDEDYDAAIWAAVTMHQSGADQLSMRQAATGTLTMRQSSFGTVAVRDED